MTAPETPAAPGPPGTAYTPVLTDILRLGRVLVSPTAVFEEQREKPTIWLPWAVVSVVVIVIAWFMKPYTLKVMELAAQAQGREMPASAVRIASVVSILGTPIGFLLLTLVSAGVMWLALLAIADQVRFRGLLSAAVFSLPVAALQVLLQSVVLALRGGPEAMRAVGDMKVSLGLDVLLSADSSLSPFLVRLLGGIGPLQIWALAITAIGVATLERTSKASAWTAATASYVVLILVTALLGGMGGAA